MNNWYTEAIAQENLYRESGFKDILKTLPVWIISFLMMVQQGVSAEEAKIATTTNYNLNESQVKQLDNSLKNLFHELNPSDPLENRKTNIENNPPKVINTNIENKNLTQKELNQEQKNIVDVVSRTIWGEAQGESWEGKLAVASTIWNRSNGNPQLLIKVIKKPKQYSIWNKITPPLGNGAEWDKVVKLSKQMAIGEFTPTTEHTHYFNPKKAHPSWGYVNNKLREPNKIIGNHVFMSPDKKRK